MIRSLYSGVAGMTTQQKKMDVIGNNISNVSTYGFKASRVTFRDVYYQTSQDAAGPTAAQGGTNPVQVGYGATMGSTDVNHSTSVMTTTGLSLDCAITGEGYFQVMDGNGNIFYTKAGMLDIDGDGNLVDVNGNFVLGVPGNSLSSDASSQKIKISLPYVNPSVSSATNKINGINVKVSTTNENSNGNVSFSFAASKNLPIGEKAQAVVTSNSITVTLNSNETFANLADLQKEVNAAITRANNGVNHAAGTFSIKFDSKKAFTTPLTGDQIVNANFGVTEGFVDVPEELNAAFSVQSVGDKFSATTPMNYKISANETAGTFKITATAQDAGGNTITYTADLTKDQMETSGSVIMDSGVDGDNFILTFPNWENAIGYNNSNHTATNASVPSTESTYLGLGSTAFALKGGTKGGAQTVADLSGLSIGSNGIIYGVHPTLGTLELGRIDLATFDNPAGLSQVGSTYFRKTANSGEPNLAKAGENGTGDLAGGTLETSNVDLSQEFSDMIVTQRGFQACSRLITVSDTMLEELINLKR